MDGGLNGWMNYWMNEWMGGRSDGWMNGWTNSHAAIQFLPSCIPLVPALRRVQ